ncbi:MAG: Ig-like domain-containing protein [Ramlibacter sp.]
MKNYMNLWAGMVLTLSLAACGGGGGSAGTSTSGGGSTPGGTATAVVSDFALFSDKTTMSNSGLDSAKLTVVAVDSNRNTVPDASVLVTADQNSVFTPTAGSKTDASGVYAGVLTIGGDKSDRDVTLAVTINGIVKKTSVRVSGSKLSLSASPSAPSPGQVGTVTAVLVDASSNPIRGVSVALGGNVPSLQGKSIVTGADGVAVSTFTAPTNAGVYTISAQGGGVGSGDYQLQVFSTSIPPAAIPAGASPSLAASPNVLATNSPGSTSNRTTLRFLFLDASNRPVQNVRVRFVDLTTGLPTVGSSIVSGASTLYTDASGAVSTQYISGQNPSPTNGVLIRACYSATDFASPSDCPASTSASLTVAGQALAVSIGDDNLLTKGQGTYIKKFAVTVADSAGRAVANAPVDISLDLTHYGKSPIWGAGNLATVPLSPLASSSFTRTGTVAGEEVSVTFNWCPNEDTNRNGIADFGENVDGSTDSNGQPTLEPRRSDMVISYDTPAVTSTDASGVLVIKVEYSQRFGGWIAYKVRVTANVAGSQGLAERTFVTDVAQPDITNGSFLTPAYGSNNCTTPN